jgi:hypothetical protein
VGSLFAKTNNCLRLDVEVETEDLEMVVVAPDGTVFRNDDRNAPTDRRPLVKIATPPNNGWYTVHIASYNGFVIDTNFTLRYGRYVTGNPNCQNPTTPSFARTSRFLDETKAKALESDFLPADPDAPGGD